MRYKKFFAVLLTAAMTMSMAACGTKDIKNTDNETGTSTDSAKEDNAKVEEESSALPIESSLKGTGPAVYGWGDASPGEAEEDASAGDADGVLQNGDVLVDINFDDEDVDGFTTYMNGGDYELAAEGGQLVAKINKCGSLDYANQAYWDGFRLNQGAVYTYSFDISSDIERKVEYRIQINGGDFHAYQGDYIDVGPEVNNFSVDFEMTENSDPAPRLVFNMGLMEDMSSDPGAHNIYIDNIKLTVKDATNAQVLVGLPNYVDVAVNQLGYRPDDEKVAIVKSDELDEEEFIVCDAATNETVYAGKLSEWIHDYGSENYVKKGDFSDLKTPGNYYVYSPEGASYEFTIEEAPYKDVFKDAVLMLYKQRCGIELESTVAGDAYHAYCHMEEATIYDDPSKTIDVTGGWHDAGDYGRYVVSGAEAVADLLAAYEDYGIEADDFGIPESGNGVSDLLDEARYELDWMLKMQDEKTGGVYHKVTALAFPETVPPEEEGAEQFVCPISDAATGDFAAVMAKASVVYKDIDSEFSKKAFDAAVKAWGYIKDNEELDEEGFKNPEDVETGEYPDRKIQDERYWAAAELYLAGYEDTLDVLKTLVSEEKLNRGLGWADVATYGDYDLAKADTEVSAKAKEKLLERADYLVKKTSEDGYFMALGTDYPWGSNMTIANNGQHLLMAAKITGDDKYSKAAKKQLDYILGTNSLGYCFITGYGVLSPTQPHHRPSQVATNVIPGMMVGGANSSLEDPYAKAVLTGQGPAMCYADNSQSYSTNEVAIYWNSPLIYLLAGEQ